MYHIYYDELPEAQLKSRMNLLQSRAPGAEFSADDVVAILKASKILRQFKRGDPGRPFIILAFVLLASVVLVWLVNDFKIPGIFRSFVFAASAAVLVTFVRLGIDSAHDGIAGAPRVKVPLATEVAVSLGLTVAFCLLSLLDVIMLNGDFDAIRTDGGRDRVSTVFAFLGVAAGFIPKRAAQKLESWIDTILSRPKA